MLEAIHIPTVQIRASVEEKEGKKFDEFTAVKYCTQVVAGINYFIKVLLIIFDSTLIKGGHCIGTLLPPATGVKVRSNGQGEILKLVKQGIGGSLRTVKVSPGDRWAWIMLNTQGSRPDFQCGQGVKHENLMGHDLDPGRGWKYKRLCSVPPPR